MLRKSVCSHSSIGRETPVNGGCKGSSPFVGKQKILLDQIGGKARVSESLSKKIHTHFLVPAAKRVYADVRLADLKARFINLLFPPVRQRRRGGKPKLPIYLRREPDGRATVCKTVKLGSTPRRCSS